MVVSHTLKNKKINFMAFIAMYHTLSSFQDKQTDKSTVKQTNIRAVKQTNGRTHAQMDTWTDKGKISSM